MNPVIINCEQGSPEWLSIRLGVITASRVYDIIPTYTEIKPKIDKKTGDIKAPGHTKEEYRKARENYLLDLIGEIATRGSDQLNAKALEWGKSNESAARAAYAFDTNQEVVEAGFVYGKDKRTGCSPDLLIKGKRKGGEIKCPLTASVHADFLLNGFVKPEYVAQVNFSMWVMDYEEWDFISYHPRFKDQIIGVTKFERDPVWSKRFDKEVPLFCEELDEALSKLNLKYGDQWK